MIDGQRRRTLTGHWLTTMVLEEVGRVFSALRCTHRLLSLLANGHPNVVTCSLEGVKLGVMRAQGVALRPYQPPNYPAKGGLACGLWGGVSCQLPRFQGQGASETHPSETSHAAQLPDCDLTGS